MNLKSAFALLTRVTTRFKRPPESTMIIQTTILTQNRDSRASTMLWRHINNRRWDTGRTATFVTVFSSVVAFGLYREIDERKRSSVTVLRDQELERKRSSVTLLRDQKLERKPSSVTLLRDQELEDDSSQFIDLSSLFNVCSNLLTKISVIPRIRAAINPNAPLNDNNNSG